MIHIEDDLRSGAFETEYIESSFEALDNDIDAIVPLLHRIAYEEAVASGARVVLGSCGHPVPSGLAGAECEECFMKIYLKGIAQ